MEKIKKHDCIVDGEYKFPPDCWVGIKAFECSNCGDFVLGKPQTKCPGCGASMKYYAY